MAAYEGLCGDDGYGIYTLHEWYIPLQQAALQFRGRLGALILREDKALHKLATVTFVPLCYFDSRDDTRYILETAERKKVLEDSSYVQIGRAHV